MRRLAGPAANLAIAAAAFTALLSPALTVALLGAIESLMSAVVADRMSNDKHNPNVELVAQGIANIGSAVFGGVCATGTVARTATNIRSGARSLVEDSETARARKGHEHKHGALPSVRPVNHSFVEVA